MNCNDYRVVSYVNKMLKLLINMSFRNCRLVIDEMSTIIGFLNTD